MIPANPTVTIDAPLENIRSALLAAPQLPQKESRVRFCPRSHRH